MPSFKKFEGLKLADDTVVMATTEAGPQNVIRGVTGKKKALKQRTKTLHECWPENVTES